MPSVRHLVPTVSFVCSQSSVKNVYYVKLPSTLEFFCHESIPFLLCVHDALPDYTTCDRVLALWKKEDVFYFKQPIT